MALVDYSDSETSDAELSTPAALPSGNSTANPLSQKPILTKPASASEPRKIKVDLPAVHSSASHIEEEEQPPAKKARTAGAFSGFNSLLPAPKRTSAQAAPKAGISLKTSSEAAFSRNPVPKLEGGDDDGDGGGANGTAKLEESEKPDGVEEVKVLGKATKFRPLSVANKKKSGVKKAKIDGTSGIGAEKTVVSASSGQRVEELGQDVTRAPPKPKRSLFSVPQTEEEQATAPAVGTYESITTHDNQPVDESTKESTTDAQTMQSSKLPAATTLDALTSDLNLTPAQRRQLFGRNRKDNDINIAHFDMSAEYAHNEELRQAGEVVEHRAVKAIAPGKHSLQQLVNNARSQQENLEDKWAAGRKERGGMGGWR